MGSPEHNEEQWSEVAEPDSDISHEDLSMGGTHGGETLPYPVRDEVCAQESDTGTHGSGTEPKVPPTDFAEDF